MSKFQQDFGDTFKKIRKAKGMTQDLVAERASLSTSYVSDVERGRANPTLSTAEKLAAALQVDVLELFNFGHHPAKPVEIRQRLEALLHDMDDKTLKGIYSAILNVFRP
jgi:transcriptional regulator with XRE-family HTH domain